MYFSYYWAKARQDDLMREAQTERELKTLRPTKKSIVSMLRARLESFAAPDLLLERARDAKTTA